MFRSIVAAVTALAALIQFALRERVKAEGANEERASAKDKTDAANEHASDARREAEFDHKNNSSDDAFDGRFRRE